MLAAPQGSVLVCNDGLSIFIELSSTVVLVLGIRVLFVGT